MSDVRMDRPGNPPIRELHVWIGHYSDGSEGMLSAQVAGLVSGMGTRTTLLVLTDRQSGERLRRVAEMVRTTSLDTLNPIITLELRSFRATAD